MAENPIASVSVCFKERLRGFLSPSYYDLTDREWVILEPLIPPARADGHHRTTDIRKVINAILYSMPMAYVAL